MYPRANHIHITENSSYASLEHAFDDTTALCLNKKNLQKNKDIIIQTALTNCNIKKKKQYSTAELNHFRAELKKVIFLNSSLPSFIGDKFEDPATANTQDEKYAICARNLLRHLNRGTPLITNAGDSVKTSPLYQEYLIKTLFEKRDIALLKAFRIATQNYLENAFNILSSNTLSAEQEKQYEIFQSFFLAATPFFDPEQDETIHIPQKINGSWKYVAYQYKRLDLSPNTGLLATLLEEEDHIYAYGLEASEKDAKSLLLLMGTTYPAGQGTGLAVAYNFYPQSSVGEGHNTTAMDTWLFQQKQKNKKVVASGISKGATLSLIAAANHADLLESVECLNPTGLCGDTLNRLNSKWQKLSKDEKPLINVFAQYGDPVFPLEKGFLEDTNIYRVLPNTDQSALNISLVPLTIRKAYEAHVHNFAGRDAVIMLKVNTKTENRSKRREFFNDVKYLWNWVRFPLEYVDLCLRIMLRKWNRFYEQNKKWVNGFLILAAVATCAALIATGFLTPVTLLFIKPLFAAAGWQLSTAAVYGITTGLALVASATLPWILQIPKKILAYSYAIFTNVVHVSTILIGSILSGLKLGLKTLFNVFSFHPTTESTFTTVTTPTLSIRRSSFSSVTILDKIGARNYLVSSSIPKTEANKLQVHRSRSNSVPNLHKTAQIGSDNHDFLAPRMR
jgi:hypothetical protein